MEGTYVFVDVETTGGQSQTDRVTEIAAIRVEDGHVVDKIVTLLDPQHYIPAYITQLTGISSNDVFGKPLFSDIAEELTTLFSGATMIAHNVRFDYSFLKAEFKRVGISFRPKMLCTVKLSRYLYPNQRRHRLEDLITAHNLSFTERHRAYDDADAIWQFWQKVHIEMSAEQIENALRAQLKTPSLPRHLNKIDIDALPEEPGVYLFKDENDYPLYIGKSVNIRRRVMSHFNRDSDEHKEFKISQQVHKVSHIVTAGELSALLTESALVKQYLPLYNRRLRRTSKLIATTKDYNPDGYITLQQKEYDTHDLPDMKDIISIHARRGMAKQTLLMLVATFDLCPKLCGLEKGTGACFRYQLGKCRGACVNEETAESYNARLEIAFEKRGISPWPYDGPIVLAETSNDQTYQQGYIVDNWVITDAITYKDDSEPVIKPYSQLFDYDAYQIVESYLRRHANKLRVAPYKNEFSV